VAERIAGVRGARRYILPSALQVSFSVQSLQPGVYSGVCSHQRRGRLSFQCACLVFSGPPPVMLVGQSGLVLTSVARWWIAGPHKTSS